MLPRAAVPTLMLKFAGVAPLILTDCGLGVQAAFAGAPPQASVTIPVNPAAPLTERLYVAVCPALIVAEADVPDCGARVKSVPVPLSGAVFCVPPNCTASMPFWVPMLAGAKDTFTMQEAPPASAAQLLLCENPAEAANAVMVIAELPELVTVTAWVALTVPTS